MEQYLFNISSLTRWLETHEIIIKISDETRADGARCPNHYNGARTGTAPPPSTPLSSRHGFCPFCLHCTHRRSPQVPRRRSRQPTPYRHSSSVDSPMFPTRSPVPPPTSTFEQFPQSSHLNSPLLPPTCFDELSHVTFSPPSFRIPKHE